MDINRVVKQALDATLAGNVSGLAWTCRLQDNLPGLACDAGRVRGQLAQFLLHLIEVCPDARHRAGRAQRSLRVRTWATYRELCVGLSIEPIPSDIGRPPAQRWLTTGQTLVQELGGWLQVDAHAEGSGLLLTMHVPLMGEEEPTPSSSAEGALRVLVIEDDPIMARALVRSLAVLGQVEVAFSGHEAMARLAVDSHFDVLLCDRSMPEGSGEDVARWIQLYRPALLSRLLFMTGNPEWGSRTRYWADGSVQGCSVPTVHKPVDPGALRDLLTSLAGRSVPPKPRAVRRVRRRAALGS